jgi:hypothetical protein
VRDPIKITTVRKAAPGGIDLGKIMIIAPVACLDQGQHARSVRAWLGAEDPGNRPPLITVRSKIILGMPPDEVEVPGLVKIGHHSYCIVQHRHYVGKCIAEEARDANCDVNPGRPSSSRSIASSPTTRRDGLIPHRHYAEQCQHFSNVITTGPHCRRAPYRQSNGLRILPHLIEMSLQQGFGHCLAGLIARRDGIALGSTE